MFVPLFLVLVALFLVLGPLFLVLVGDRYTEDIELEDAIHTAILTLKEGFEGQIASDNIEIGIIGKDQKFR